ncbi:7TM diverse intracellular signaling domain-containing protein [Ramlibacter sp.]|uniref:sensor histidine kinase n=1 Tax=Ramlibacter sp. TaxID=1917967 RepID=UPI002D30F59B|nr:7TM diverse intracellular signaling domain-containing protein [Ramlibacter sp.]HYD75366.1 7TM diverse intracellular signaling domain-containing protein [Ramlibacter sp.]
MRAGSDPDRRLLLPLAPWGVPGIWRWCCALACLLFAMATPARAVDLVLGGGESYDLSPVFHYLEDPSGQLRFDDVREAAAQSRFQPVPASGVGANFGMSRSAWWLKATVQVPLGAPRDWLLEVAYPPLDRIEVFSPDLAFGYERAAGGDSVPFVARAVAHRNHVFPVRLLPGTSATLYLRVQSAGTVVVPARLWQPAALAQYDQGAYSLLSLYFGLLLGLLLYNLLLFVSVREPGYLYYVAFAAAMGLGQAALSGLGAQYLWPGAGWWNAVSVPVGLSAAAIFGLLFARDFLSSAARMPRLDRLMLAELAGWGLALLAALVLPYVVSAYMVLVLAVVSVVTMAVIGCISIRHEFAGARWFFTAWALLLLGVGTLAMHDTGLLPSNALTSNALLIGSALEMVLLSFALGDRINVARRFKAAAQARIAAEHAMVQSLQQSEARIKEALQEREIVLENSIVGIAFLTPEGRLKWGNKAMLDMFGAGKRKVTSMEPFYLSREQYLEVGGDSARAVARGETFERELQVQRFDGTRIWIHLSGKAVNGRDLSGGTVWVIMDITQRKQLQEQLRVTMSEREAVLNNAVVGIVLSVNRQHEWVNEKFARMMGYPRQVLIGQSSRYLHADDSGWERFGEVSRAALVATNAYMCEHQVRRRDGELLWVQMGGSCVRAHDPDSGVVWTFLDITERKAWEAEVRSALDQQRKLNELRARVVAVASREFRSPLAAIRSAQARLRDDSLEASARRQALDAIGAATQRMSSLLDRVGVLARADAGLLAFNPVEVDLHALCRQLVEKARAQHPERACEVDLEWGEDAGRGVFDPHLLRHILANLLSNAVKYSPAGGRIGFAVRREGSEMVFEVRDRGIGIPPQEMEDLFGSFHRASNAGAIQGTGLGLAIARSAVETHGGRIEAASELGVGTTFTVRLPLQMEAAEAAA